MVARLTPDQKVACSIHVGFNTPDPSPDNVLFICLRSAAAFVNMGLQASWRALWAFSFLWPFAQKKMFTTLRLVWPFQIFFV